MFVTAKAQDFITYSRSSIGTYIGSDGLLKTAAVDEARIEYAADGTVKGLLIEEQRENLITYSEDFFNAAWGKFSGGVIDADAATSPDGTSNASQFYGSDGAHVIEDVSATAGTTYTYSVFLKTNGTDDLTVSINYRDGGGSSINYYGVDFNTATGVISAPDLGVQATTSSAENFGNGWFRLSISHEAPATTTTARVYMANRTGAAASSSDGYLLYGAQLEEGSFVTSYIPTSGSQQIRSADIASIPVSAFEYNDQAGTVVVEAQTNNPASSLPHMWQFDAGVSNTRIACTFRSSSGAVRMFIQNGGSTDASLYRGTPLTDTTEVTTAGSWQADDIAFSYDGSAAAPDTDGCAIPSVSTLRIGSSNVTATTALNGHIRSLKYYPRKLNDTDMFSETDNTIQNGLTFNLDATAYTNYSTSNLLSPYPWTVGTGSETFYSKNGSTDENERVVDTNPFNDTDIVWQSPSNDATSNADGGWNTTNFAVDISKTYRFSVWTRKKDIQGNGRFYLGSNGYNSSVVNIGILNRTAGATNTNFYFTAPRFDDGSISPSVSLGDWVLVVGHIWPEGSGTGSIHPDSGIYETDGTKKTSYPGEKDGVWQTGTTLSKHRSYQYYSTTTNEKQQWWAPRVDVLDGNEPTISELINGAGRNWELTSQSSVGLNGSYWDGDTSGTFIFDGTDDYIKLPTSISIYNSSYTFEAWINVDTAIGEQGILGDQQYDWFGFRLNSSNKLFIQHRQTNSDINSLTGVSNVGTSWAHVAVVFDINAGMRLYLNGELDASNTNKSYFGIDSTTRGPQYIGRNDKSTFGSNTPYFDGKIARLLGYTRALTATEIQKNYNTSKARF